MQPFTQLTGMAAPLLRENIDTDLIIPKQFLKTLTRSGLGKHLFYDLRYDDEGQERPEFILNQAPYRQATVLLGGGNFGCGSSREHAPWSLLDFGIRCVLAPSFADIFFNNCIQNGILPGRVERPVLEHLARQTQPITVDLVTQTLTDGSSTWSFELPSHRREALLQGLDAIGQTEQALAGIQGFEAERATQTPWLNGAALPRLGLQT